MELKKVKKEIENLNEINDDNRQEFENKILVAFPHDSGLYLDSEAFEIMGVETKEDFLQLIDLLIKRCK